MHKGDAKYIEEDGATRWQEFGSLEQLHKVVTCGCTSCYRSWDQLKGSNFPAFWKFVAALSIIDKSLFIYPHQCCDASVLNASTICFSLQLLKFMTMEYVYFG